MTKKNGFDSAYYFLHKWYEITKSDDIGELLSLMQPLDDGKPADSSMWDYWLESCEKAEKQGKPPKKILK